jgi:hypothetical protein
MPKKNIYGAGGRDRPHILSREVTVDRQATLDVVRQGDCGVLDRSTTHGAAAPADHAVIVPMLSDVDTARRSPSGLLMPDRAGRLRGRGT